MSRQILAASCLLLICLACVANAQAGVGAPTFSPTTATLNTATTLTLQGTNLSSGDFIKIIATGDPAGCNSSSPSPSVTVASSGSLLAFSASMAISEVSPVAGGTSNVCYKAAGSTTFVLLPGVFTVNGAASIVPSVVVPSAQFTLTVSGVGLSANDKLLMVSGAGASCSAVTASASTITLGTTFTSIVANTAQTVSFTGTTAGAFTVCYKLAGTSSYVALPSTFYVAGVTSIAPTTVIASVTTSFTVSGFGLSVATPVLVVPVGTPCTYQTVYANSVGGVALGSPTGSTPGTVYTGWLSVGALTNVNICVGVNVNYQWLYLSAGSVTVAGVGLPSMAFGVSQYNALYISPTWPTSLILNVNEVNTASGLSFYTVPSLAGYSCASNPLPAGVTAPATTSFNVQFSTINGVATTNIFLNLSPQAGTANSATGFSLCYSATTTYGATISGALIRTFSFTALTKTNPTFSPSWVNPIRLGTVITVAGAFPSNTGNSYLAAVPSNASCNDNSPSTPVIIISQFAQPLYIDLQECGISLNPADVSSQSNLWEGAATFKVTAVPSPSASTTGQYQLCLFEGGLQYSGIAIPIAALPGATAVTFDGPTSVTPSSVHIVDLLSASAASPLLFTIAGTNLNPYSDNVHLLLTQVPANYPRPLPPFDCTSGPNYGPPTYPIDEYLTVQYASSNSTHVVAALTYPFQSNTAPTLQAYLCYYNSANAITSSLNFNVGGVFNATTGNVLGNYLAQGTVTTVTLMGTNFTGYDSDLTYFFAYNNGGNGCQYYSNSVWNPIASNNFVASTSSPSNLATLDLSPSEAGTFIMCAKGTTATGLQYSYGVNVFTVIGVELSSPPTVMLPLAPTTPPLLLFISATLVGGGYGNYPPWTTYVLPPGVSCDATASNKSLSTQSGWAYDFADVSVPASAFASGIAGAYSICAALPGITPNSIVYSQVNFYAATATSVSPSTIQPNAMTLLTISGMGFPNVATPYVFPVPINATSCFTTIEATGVVTYGTPFTLFTSIIVIVQSTVPSSSFALCIGGTIYNNLVVTTSPTVTSLAADVSDSGSNGGSDIKSFWSTPGGIASLAVIGVAGVAVLAGMIAAVVLVYRRRKERRLAAVARIGVNGEVSTSYARLDTPFVPGNMNAGHV